jgi:hypothetical protein
MGKVKVRNYMTNNTTRTLVESNDFVDVYDVYLDDELIGQDQVFKNPGPEAGIAK